MTTMRYETTLCAAAALLFGGSALATDLNVDVRSFGKSAVTVGPGQTVRYHVTGELGDSDSLGLAMFAFDLAFDGGSLLQADPPTSAAMLNFATPLGLNNPAGFGGTPVAGRLVQVGGAQNTIRNTFAPKPMGQVITGVAQPGNRVLLATGTLAAPAAPGSYVLKVEELFANVIRAGETGVPFWRVEAAGEGVLGSLTVHVLDCEPATYCTAKVSSLGCLPAIGWSGTPTLSGPDDFHVTAADVVNGQFGFLFWGLEPQSKPFMGGTLCVVQPVVRTPVQNSGGNPSPGTDCSGSFDLAFTQTHMAQHGLTAGDTVYAQYWYRDPAHPDGTGVGLSDALEATICP